MKSYKAAQIQRHINALAVLLNDTVKNPDNLPEYAMRAFKRLRRVECEANRAAIAYCEVQNYDWEKARENIEFKVKRIFGGKLPPGFFVNGDPRGYALKIDSGQEYESEYHPEYIPDGLYKDWGGYGILAPEF